MAIIFRDQLSRLADELAPEPSVTGVDSSCDQSRGMAPGAGILMLRYGWLTEKRAATLAAGASILAAAMQVCLCV